MIILSSWSVFLICSLAFIQATIRIDKDLRQFVDEFGRVRIYHGANVVVKVPPYLPKSDKFDPLYSMADVDFEIFKKMGFNIVRLGILWEAFEIEEGVFDFKYLEEIHKLVNKFGVNGITVMLDSHQDLFSRIICGEGVPAFYAKKLSYDKDCSKSMIENFLHHLDVCLPMRIYNLRTDNNSVPLIEDCKKHSFLNYHTSPELTSLYARFYDNENGIIDKFIVFWGHFAKKFKNNPYIFGYDIWNEPWPGDMWNSIRFLIPGKSDKEQILPFYKKVNQKLREIDDSFVFVFQPTPFPDTLPFLGGVFAGHMEETPAGTDFLDKQVLNEHSYCCQAERTVCASGEPEMKHKDICRSFHMRKLADLAENTRSLGVPFIITEFGACRNTESCFHEITSFADAADSFITSWVYWQYKPFGDFTTSCDYDEGIFDLKGEYQEFKIKGLARTYTKAFQGIPILMNFDYTTAIFRCKFYINTKINAPTEVYYSPEVYYKSGINMKIVRGGFLANSYNITMIKDDHHLKVKFEKLKNEVKDDKIIEFFVYPKSEIEIFNFNRIPANYHSLETIGRESIKNYAEVELTDIYSEGNMLNIISKTKEHQITFVKVFTEERELSLECSINKECFIKPNMVSSLRVGITKSSSLDNYSFELNIKYAMNNYITIMLK